MFEFKPFFIFLVFLWLFLLSINAFATPISDYDWDDFPAFSVPEHAELKKQVNAYCANNSELRLGKIDFLLIRLKDYTSNLNDVVSYDRPINFLYRDSRIRGDP